MKQKIQIATSDQLGRGAVLTRPNLAGKARPKGTEAQPSHGPGVRNIVLQYYCNLT
jgi:hypothetical protein